MPEDKKIDIETKQQDLQNILVKMRANLLEGYAQCAMAMSVLPRYRHNKIADLSSLIIEPLVSDRIAIAYASKSKDEQELSGPYAAIAIWATVSGEVDAKICEQIKGGSFPVKLDAADWRSGDKVWLLDLIAPNQKMATEVLARFNTVSKKDEVHMHPYISKLVDPEVLKKMRKVTKEAA